MLALNAMIKPSYIQIENKDVKILLKFDSKKQKVSINFELIHLESNIPRNMQIKY